MSRSATRKEGAVPHSSPRKVLVIDIGGTSVKVLATGQAESRSFPSGPTLTPRRMVTRVRKLVSDWAYDVVSIGYPGPVLHGRPVSEPHNLGRGWVGFDFTRAFGCPVKTVNDAPCRPWDPTLAARCSFSAWERAWAAP
jgi:predicted NBD/HSP70 family sugar kinase